MALKKIVKLTQAQYDTLASGGTVGDYTGLDDDFLYVIQGQPNYYTKSESDSRYSTSSHTHTCTGTQGTTGTGTISGTSAATSTHKHAITGTVTLSSSSTTSAGAIPYVEGTMVDGVLTLETKYLTASVSATMGNPDTTVSLSHTHTFTPTVTTGVPVNPSNN